MDPPGGSPRQRVGDRAGGGAGDTKPGWNALERLAVLVGQSHYDSDLAIGIGRDNLPGGVDDAQLDGADERLEHLAPPRDQSEVCRSR